MLLFYIKIEKITMWEGYYNDNESFEFIFYEHFRYRLFQILLITNKIIFQKIRIRRILHIKYLSFYIAATICIIRQKITNFQNLSLYKFILLHKMEQFLIFWSYILNIWTRKIAEIWINNTLFKQNLVSGLIWIQAYYKICQVNNDYETLKKKNPHNNNLNKNFYFQLLIFRIYTIYYPNIFIDPFIFFAN